MQHALPQSTHLTPVKPDTFVDNPQPRGTQKVFRCWDLRKDAVAQDLNILNLPSREQKKKALKIAKGEKRDKGVQWSFAKNIPKGRCRF